jgi:hypothetical protein
MIDLLPTSSDWVPTRITNGLLDAYQVIAGNDAVRALARNANRGGLVRIIEPLLRTAMRLGGASPAALLSRLDVLLRQQQEGYEFRWSALDARSGTLLIITHGTPETPASAVSWEGALAIAFDLTNTTGTIRCSKIERQGEGSVSTLAVRW